MENEAAPAAPGGVVVVVDGPIGVGKSTVLQRLRDLRGPPVATLPEPVEDWAPWLARFYAEPSRWALGLQLEVLVTLRRRAREAARHASQGRAVFLERDARSAREIFVPLSVERGHLDAEEAALLGRAADAMEPDGGPPEGARPCRVLLRADPHICVARTRRRARESERGIENAWIRRVAEQYDAVAGSYDAVVDASHLTPDQAAAAVLTAVARGAPPPPGA